jgi:hypothetical protein
MWGGRRLKWFKIVSLSYGFCEKDIDDACSGTGARLGDVLQRIKTRKISVFQAIFESHCLSLYGLDPAPVSSHSQEMIAKMTWQNLPEKVIDTFGEPVAEACKNTQVSYVDVIRLMLKEDIPLEKAFVQAYCKDEPLWLPVFENMLNQSSPKTRSPLSRWSPKVRLEALGRISPSSKREETFYDSWKWAEGIKDKLQKELDNIKKEVNKGIFFHDPERFINETVDKSLKKINGLCANNSLDAHMVLEVFKKMIKKLYISPSHPPTSEMKERGLTLSPFGLKPPIIPPPPTPSPLMPSSVSDSSWMSAGE